ncbi:hydantoinase/oxoprolinase family protein [Allokutzneria multivorans]|uniref:Hydantoinase/oxoprolinase family protein n=1 Tax=Allokutzneria multivorans TaxID=1142134 RepID=A0ABP7R2F1_9PSEU
MGYRLGVDVGGTFTDVLLVDQVTGRTFRVKTPSTPDNAGLGVRRGIALVCEQAGIAPGEVSRVVHGTTLATNLILQGKGARVGLVTTHGFRRMLQIARSYLPGPLAGWVQWPKPEPLARMENTIEVAERVDPEGRVVRPLDVQGAREALRGLRGSGIEALTISLLNSYANDVHERVLAEIAAEELPGLPISLSASVIAEPKEYERALAAVADSYVRPSVSRYLADLGEVLDGAGITAPLSILRGDGVQTMPDRAADHPLGLLLSGPVGGVAGASWFAEQLGLRDFLTFDMGGTSTDITLVRDGRPRLAKQAIVGKLEVRTSSVDVRSVGAGGGSIALVDEQGELVVGPESAGARPGPVAYGLGGDEPTVTDANVLLGHLPGKLAGGEIMLDRAAARRALKGLAHDLGISRSFEAAEQVVETVNENMAAALRLVSVRQGAEPKDFALLAYGGAGPLHANAIGVLTGSWPVIVPPAPGVLCAHGDATAGLRDEDSALVRRPLDAIDNSEFRALVDDLEKSVCHRLEDLGVTRAEQTLCRSAVLRSEGREFSVHLTDAVLASADPLGALGFPSSASASAELVRIDLVAQGPRLLVAPTALPPGEEVPVTALVAHTEIWHGGRPVDARIYDRAKLLAGNVIVGPAIIVEMDSTTLVLPEHSATVHPTGCLLLRPLT